MFLAKALYDNIAETPDELAFRRGDVITVIEQDTGGLEGWWLCTLRDRQGIAPGNRLKILSGMTDSVVKNTNVQEKDVTVVKTGDQPNVVAEDYDVPPTRYFPSTKAAVGSPLNEFYDVPTNLPAPHPNTSGSFYDTPPNSNRASLDRTPPGSNRASRDSLTSASSHSQRHSGDPLQQLLYQTPPSSKRASAESGSSMLSGGERLETTPSSKRASLERILSGEQQTTYDSPPASQSEKGPVQNMYDTPNPRSRPSSHSSVGVESRGSMRSVASSESLLSGSSAHLTRSHQSGASLPDSARSSLDASLSLNEPYDLPSKESRAVKQLSMDSGLGVFYHTPVSGRHSHSSLQPPNLTSGACHHANMKRSRSLENTLDDVYDSPPKNTVTPKGKGNLKLRRDGFGSASAVNHDPRAVYDIPPQVTRDSVISARSDSSEDSWRLSSCSMDSRGSGADFSTVTEGVYEELLLDLNSAVELLVKLQQNITHAASSLLSFVSYTWRTKESLEMNVYDIKVACMNLEKALCEFMDFAQGTLANSTRLSDKKLVKRLIKQISPLQQHSRTVSSALCSLEDMKWQVALLAEPVPTDLPDHLGDIISLAKDMVPEVKKLASLIQGNSTLLFKRSSNVSTPSASSETNNVASKPPIRPKPDMLVRGSPGGGFGTGIVIPRPRSLQQRPLPAPPVPVSSRPLPPTPIEHKLRSLELTASLDNLSDYTSVPACTDGDDGNRDYSDLQQEYDYVQLESPDECAQQQTKDQQEAPQQGNTCAKNTEEEVEPAAPPTDGDQWSETVNQKCEQMIKEVTPEHAGHLEDISATSSDKHIQDIDMVPTKDEPSRTISSQEDNIPAQLLPTDEDSVVKRSVMNTAESGIPNHLPHSNGLDLSYTVDTVLDANDKQVLCYYCGQLETHSTLLTNAIDTFFNCIENNEPPNVFISNSKFVIVTAHKLVYISDALHRSLQNSEVRDKIMHCAQHVCECLKVSVQATKTAALQYPSVPAVQEMVDRVVDVSHAAHELKLVITQASAL